jgi:hypothetical protein
MPGVGRGGAEPRSAGTADIRGARVRMRRHACLAAVPRRAPLRVNAHACLARRPRAGTGGSLGRGSVSAFAGLLATNPLLAHLDLSYNKV